MLDRFFDKRLSIYVKFFNLLAIVGVISGIVISVITAVLWKHVGITVIDITVSACMLAVLFIAEKTKKYRICSWILVVAVFMVLFPASFFESGGYRGGAVCFFITGIISTLFLFEKRIDRVIALTLEILVYISCFILSFVKPELITWFNTEEGYFIDALISFAAAIILITLLTLMQIRMYRGKQKEVEELNIELAARNETLSEYDSMKSNFLATVAHEVNTPLAIIATAGNNTLTILDEEPIDVEIARKNQKLITKKVKLINKLMLDLMDYTAIETGRLPLSREPVNLDSFLRKTAASLENQLGSNRLVYHHTAGLQNVWIDPYRIEQVMTNLISNAVEHTENGTIAISLTRGINVQTVSVSDDGKGMTPKIMKNAFRKYSSSKLEHWKHGMGLFICRQIILAHGGEIWIESEHGRGTTVSFTLKENIHEYGA